MNKNKQINLISLIGAIIGVAIIIVFCMVYDFDEINNKNTYNDIPFELNVPQIYVLSNYVDTYNRINIGMSEEDVIAILGEPTNVNDSILQTLTWSDEYRNNITVNIKDNKIDRVILNINSRSRAGIKLSSEIGTEIEDLEVLREQLRYSMTFEEATQILGDRYIETVKGTEDIIYDWYDKKENHMGIQFTDGIITGIFQVMQSY